VPDPDPVTRPGEHEAQDDFAAWLVELQMRTPRVGLGAPTTDLVDHIVALSGRYGPHLFVCYRDSRVPATTNELEGFFGVSKQHDRRALRCGSTAQSPVHNLGADYLVALHQVRSALQRPHRDRLCPDATMAIDPQAYRNARSDLRQREEPAQKRRAAVRSLPKCIRSILDRWRPPSV